jgi:hypothetical protein
MSSILPFQARTAPGLGAVDRIYYTGPV